MLLVDTVPDIKFDWAKAKQRLLPYLRTALDEASDEYVKMLKQEVHTVTDVGRTGGGAPGKPAWRNELDADIKKLWIQESEKMLEAAVGANDGYGEGSYSYVRAMLIAYGSGSRAHGAPGWRKHAAMHTGPRGRVVWDDDLSGQKTSAATRHNLPLEFNQYGNDFINRAFELMKLHFDETMKKALEHMPAT